MNTFLMSLKNYKTPIESCNNFHLNIKRMSGCIFIFEGLPGVGKSLLAKSIANSCENSIMLEEEFDETILKEYIDNMKEKASEFQFSIQESTIKRMKRAVELAKQGFNVYVDRGLEGNACFASLQNQNGLINDDDMIRYRETFKYEKIEGLHEILMKTIYMRASPQFCLQRIKQRARSGEDSYSLDYLTGLKMKHDEFLKDVLIIDCEQNFELDKKTNLIPIECVRDGFLVY